MSKEATEPEGSEEAGFEEDEPESGSKQEWFLHPETVRQRKLLGELRIKQTKEMVRQGLASPDPTMRGLASQIRTLEAQILSLGGQELIWPAPEQRKAMVRR